MRRSRLVIGICALVMAGAGTAHARELVVGGSPASAGSWPSVVALVKEGQSPFAGQYCAGTLVASQWVVTAAHCTFKDNPALPGAKIAMQPSEITAALGLVTLPQTTTGFQSRAVNEIVVAPGYASADPSSPNDLAMLHLDAPASAPAAPMELVAPSDAALWATGASAQIAGWGVTQPGGAAIDTLQQATVPIVDDAVCGANYAQGIIVGSLMVCAGASAIGACSGDSGGPLAVTRPAGVRVLVGTTSFSALPCAQANFPAVFTELAAFRSFVISTMAGVPPPIPPPPTAPPAPVNLAAPVATGHGRIGAPVVATPGSWNVSDAASFQWSRETAPGSGVFAPIAGATAASYVPGAADVQARLRVDVTVANASGVTTAASNAILILPRFRVVGAGAPTVTVSSGIARVVLRVRAEPRTKLTIRILGPSGALRTPITRASRVAGFAPRVVSGRLVGKVGAGSVHPVTVAFRGRTSGTPRTVRIVIVATNGLGERAETTIRVRVRV